MKLSNFDYYLPDELIAKHPVAEREKSRLMVVHKKSKKIEHRIFSDILEYFNEKDVMVFNNTKVFPAVLKGKKEKTDADIEVFLLRELNAETRLWDVLVNPARKIRIGNKLYFTDDLVAEVIDNTTSRGRVVRFLYDGDYKSFKKLLKKLGNTPLPPALERAPEPSDKERYQTVFAKHEGAVAAPTAGMHFSKTLLKRLEIQGVNFAEITLHAGIGNFRQIEVEDLSKHKIDAEQVIAEDSAVETINNAKAEGKNICAVGTTVIKTLETIKTTDEKVAAYAGWTNKFIFPPHDIKIPNRMISNFQLPFTPMLMTVASFGGYRLIMEAYNQAVEEKYRFGTYGDAMLII